MGKPVAWVYVDAGRTHRVEARVRTGTSNEFVVVERAVDAAEVADVFERRHFLAEPWEATVHQHELEHRLALLGEYVRSAGGPWTPVRNAARLVEVDMRPLEMEDQGGQVQFHHFVHGEEHAVTLVAILQDLARGPRWLLARLDYPYPDVESGNLQVIHPHLPPTLFRSVLAEQHLELRSLGFRKSAASRADLRAFQALNLVLQSVLARLLGGRLGVPGSEVPYEGRDALAAIEAVAALRRANEAGRGARRFETDEEIGPEVGGVVTNGPEVMMEDISGDVVQAVQDPRLEQLHRTYFTPEQEARLIEAGELAIHRTIVKMQAEADPRTRHLVGLLEASMLVRRALKKRSRVDRAMVDRVLHAPVMLGL